MPDLVSANVKRHRLAAKVQRFCRGLDESRGANFVRNRPSYAAWMIVFVVLGFQIQVWEGPPKGPEYSLSARDECLERMAKGAVGNSLKVIGHGVQVSTVRVRPLGYSTLATYNMTHDSVEFTTDYSYRADQVLHTAAHESVHAIFDQAFLNPTSPNVDWDRWMLVQEVTAEVLGAHIAGRVRTLSGGNGEALTKMLIARYRNVCDRSSNESIHRKIWIAAIRMGVDKIDQDLAYSIAIHFGPVELVDAIDKICRENPDPWEAAHVVAERYPPGELEE